MPKAHPIQQSFNGGELSPLLEGRTDFAKYRNGCQILANFLPTIQGPARKRSGTRFVHETKDSTQRSALIPFEFSTTQAYVLEFGHLYMRVYFNNGIALEPTNNISVVSNTTPIQITTTGPHGYSTGDDVRIAGTGRTAIDGNTYTITVISPTVFSLDGTTAAGADAGGTAARIFTLTTPYTAAQVDAIQFAQSADVLYLAHPDHPPAKVERTGHTSWTYNAIAFEWQPFEDENTDQDVFIWCSGNTVGSTITIRAANQDLFQASDVGRYLKVREDVNQHNFEHQGLDTATPTQWANHEDGTVVEGAHIARDGRVYRVVDTPAAGAQVGADIPQHTEGVSFDGKNPLLFVHRGAGYVQIATFVDAREVTATVIKELPRGCGTNDFGNSQIRGSAGGTEPLGTGTISGITQANPAVVTTVAPHNLRDGDRVIIDNVTGMVEINQLGSVINVLTTTTFELTDIDSTGFTAYGAAGNFYWGQWRWALGLFGGSNGHPRSVAFFEQRLWWAGAAGAPQTLVGSRTADFENHETTDEDESALRYTLSADQVNVIEWLNAGTSLIAGTTRAEFVLSGGSREQPLTPGTVKVDRNTNYGSRAGVMPVRIEQVLLFVQRAGRKLREFVFDFDSDSFVGPDMTVLAEHLLEGRIRRMAFQQEPQRILWCVLDDGDLRAFTYERTQQVTAWHRQELGGAAVDVESVAVIPHPDGDEDQVWFIVERTINGAAVRYVEYLEKDYRTTDEQDEAFFVDSGLSYNSPQAVVSITRGAATNMRVTNAEPGLIAEGDLVDIEDVGGTTEINGRRYRAINVAATNGDTTFRITDPVTGAEVDSSGFGAYTTGGEVRRVVTSVSGLDHLIGETVKVLGNGSVQTDKVVDANGAITLDPGASTVQVGLGYTARLQTMRLDAGAADGTAQGKISRVNKIVVRLHQTGGGLLYGPSDVEADMDEVEFRVPSDPMDGPVPLFDGDTDELDWQGGWERGSRISLRHGTPMPCTIVAIMPMVAAQDR